MTLFKNKGAAAGASLPHPHSQVVGLSYVPRAVTARTRRWLRHSSSTGRCLLCHEMEATIRSGERVIMQEDGFMLYTPFAASMTGEIVLAPERHHPSFAAADDAGLQALAPVLVSALRRMLAAFDDPPYNLVLQTWPDSATPDALHWHLRIIPRLAVLGGFELATGDLATTLAPEAAAALYREQASS